MSKDIETIEEVLKQFAPDHWAILDLGQALQQIEKIIKERESQIELHYLEKLNTVYDDINTGVAKKQSNSTFYIKKAIHTEGEIKNIKSRLALTNALYGEKK